MLTSKLYMGTITLMLYILKKKFKEGKAVSTNESSNISTPQGSCED